MEFNTENIGWPEDTAILSYGGDPNLLIQTVMQLTFTDYVFVVSPRHQAIAMSKDAAREIGVFIL